MNRHADRFLERVLAPIGLDEFFATHWERGPLHVARESTEHFADLIDAARIETLLGTAELRFPAVQLSRSGDPIDASDYTDTGGAIVPRRLLARHRDGATIVLSGAHRLFDTLGDLVRGGQAALGLRCQANLYLSPPGRQGFDPHYDSHDVFVLQASGRKTFNFYARGVALPFRHERFERGMDIGGERRETVALEPGDTLYIPRGVAHDAVADPSAPSLHVTFGVSAVTVADLLREVLALRAERDGRLRRSVPRALWRATGTRDGVAGEDDGLVGTVRELLGTAALDDELDEALARLRDEVFIDCVEDCDGALTVPSAAEPTSDTLVAPADALIDVERRGALLRLRGFGRVMALEEPFATAAERLLERGHARVGELVGLDEEQRLTLARRLLREGFVGTVP